MGYWKRFNGHFWGDVQKFTASHVIGALLTVGIVAFQVRYGLITHAQTSGAYWSIVWPYLILLGFILLWHCIQTPAELDAERGEALQAETLRADRELARHTRPEIIPELIACFWDVDWRDGVKHPVSILYAYIRLRNLVDVDTLILNYQIEIKIADEILTGNYDQVRRVGRLKHNQPADWSDNEHTELGNYIPYNNITDLVHRNSPLKKGLHVEGWIGVPLPMDIAEGESIEADIVLIITDAFNIRYRSKETHLSVHSAQFVEHLVPKQH